MKNDNLRRILEYFRKDIVGHLWHAWLGFVWWISNVNEINAN